MNEFMNELATVETLTTEILIYKQQTAMNIIEIGKRLAQVKEQLPHGEWLPWLENRVEFSSSTAAKFMKAANELGNVAALPHLGTAKLFALLGTPEEHREEVAAKADSMSVREIQELNKKLKNQEQLATTAKEERDEMQDELNHMKENLRQLITEKLALQNKTNALAEENDDYKTTIEQAKMNQDSLVEKLDKRNQQIKELNEQLEAAAGGNTDNGTVAELTAKLETAQGEIKKLQTELAKPVTVETVTVEKIPEATVQELARLQAELEQLKTAPKESVRADASELKYRIVFEQLKTNFNQLLQSLSEITDETIHARYQAATKKLIDVMGAKL